MNGVSFVTCRVMPPLLEGEGKTILRMSRQDMDKLGIESGDVVLVSGNRTTAAVCLESDASHQDPNVEYLSKPETFYPIVRLSSAVFSNARVGHGAGALLKIARLSSAEQVREAVTVTLSTTKEASAVFRADYIKRIDFAKGLGNLVSKGDMINFPLIGSDDGRRFPSIVLDVEPRHEQNIWMTGPNTKFELREVDPDVYSRGLYDSSKLVDLTGVAPIVKKIQITKNVNLTVPFLEIYVNGAKIFFYLTERIDQVETVNMDGKEVMQPLQTLKGLPLFNMEISDDKGNSYSHMMADGHGSGVSFPSSSPGWEYCHRQTISYGVWPEIPENARKITVLVKELFWVGRNTQFHFQEPPQNFVKKEQTVKENKTGSGRAHFMQPIAGDGNLYVFPGPWEFDIELG